MFPNAGNQSQLPASKPSYPSPLFHGHPIKEPARWREPYAHTTTDLSSARLDIRPKNLSPGRKPKAPHVQPPIQPTQNPLSQKRNIELVDLTGSESSDSDILSTRPPKRSRTSSQTTDSGSASVSRTGSEADSEIPWSKRSGISGDTVSKPPRPVDQTPLRPASTNRSSKYPGQHLSAVLVPGRPRPPPTQAEQQKRRRFLENLSVLKGVSLYNDVDNDSPPVNFRFIKECVLGPGVHRATEEVMLGCECHQKHRQARGCVYLDSCSCIQDSGVNDFGKKVFPYGLEGNTGILRKVVLDTRNHIYECNSRCDCAASCRNRVVQHGRKVKLEIFKTLNRGWGLRCKRDLVRGAFIDTYRGEIITSDEADIRGQGLTEDENNFFFDYDKFRGTGVFDADREYVCDGRYMGAPTRFINHSCNPNCAIYTVSYNHNDRNIYELAFFARENIPSGTELTFDYYDQDDGPPISDARADEIELEKGYRPTRCLCGSKDCRRYLFVMPEDL